MAETKSDPFKLVTPEFRGSYVHLVKPRAANKKAEPKYSICIVLDKDDPFWKKLERLTQKAAAEKFGKVPRNLVSTVHDGDEQDEEKEKEEFFGCYYVNATSDTKPGVIDADGEDLIDPGELYSGAWYRASVRVGAWHFEDMNRKGVSLYLDNVMKVRDDEPFSGKASAASDFADYVDKGDGEEDDDDPTA